MILSNQEIANAIRRGDIRIGDLTGGENPGDEPFNTSAVDLHLADEISKLKAGPAAIDLTRQGLPNFLKANSDPIRLARNQPFRLEPGDFLIARTLETVAFPVREGRPRYAARVEGRSSIARCGVLVHFTAPTIHSGYTGTITLEITNLSPMSFLLSPGMKICQLIIEEVRGDVLLTPSQFRGQTTPTGS
jgi:dCTP deaminase